MRVVSMPSSTSGSSGSAARVRERGPTRPRKVVSREAAEKRFVEQWVAGHRTHPDIYPGRNPGISNDQKEEIISKIERGLDPADAFLSIFFRGAEK